MDSESWAFLCLAALAWSAVGYKASALRHRRDASVYALVAVIAFPATAFTVAAPVVYRTLDRSTGVANLATLVVYLCITAYSVTALIMLLLWHLPSVEARRRARRLLIAYSAVLATMSALFAAAHVPIDHPGTFEAAYGVDPIVGTFMLVYVTAFTTALGALVHRGFGFARRVARAGGHPWLAWGLRAVAAGSVVTVGYSAGLAAYVINGWLGTRRPTLIQLGIACACIGAVIVTAGFTAPTWGRHVSAVRHRLHLATAYLRLWPLWHLLYTAVPGIALDPPRSRWAELAALRDLDFRLYRRLIEIHDGQLALAPYIGAAPPDTPHAQRVRVPAAAQRQAHQLRCAARTLANGDRPRRVPQSPANVAQPDADTAGSGDPANELAWLLHVATALRRLPGKDTPSDHRRPSGEPAC